MSRAPTVLFALILTLTAAAASVLAVGARRPAWQAEQAREFHRLVLVPPGRCPAGAPKGRQDCPIPGFAMTR
jgi:hypothetical protein